MYTFLKNPNIPQGKVSHVVLANDRELSQALLRYEIKVLPVAECKHIQAPVASHADMLCNYVGDGKIFLERSQNELRNSLSNLKLDVKYICKDLHPEYPYDILLNCTIIGDKIICNKEHTAKEIIDFCNERNFTFIDVKQGYSKCSVCVVNEDAIITDDVGIAQKGVLAGIDVLLIEKGDIYINKYNYGFIGGCCGMIGKNQMAFCGNIKNHRNSHEILKFLHKYGVEAISLNNGNLIDIGGIIPICEKIIN